MSRITDLSPHHSSHQLPDTQSAKGKNLDQANSENESNNHQTNTSEKNGGNFENLKPVSGLIDAALHSKHLLSKKLDDRIAKSKNKSEHNGNNSANHTNNRTDNRTDNRSGRKFESLKTVSTLIDSALDSKHISSKKSDAHVSGNHDNHDNNRHDNSAHQQSSERHQSSEPHHAAHNRNARQSNSVDESKNHQTKNSETTVRKPEDHNQTLSIKDSKDHSVTPRTHDLKTSDEHNPKGEIKRQPENPRLGVNSAHENHHENHRASAHENREVSSHENHEIPQRQNNKTSSHQNHEVLSHQNHEASSHSQQHCEVSFHENYEVSFHENHGESLPRNRESSPLQNHEVTFNISDLTTTLQVLKRGLVKHAAETGLPINEQEKFAGKHLKNFIGQIQAKGLENLLNKTGDFSLLNFSNSLFKAKITGNQLQMILGKNALDDLSQIKQQLGVKTGGNFTGSVNASSSQPDALNSNNVSAQRMTIEARLPAPVNSSGEFVLLKAAIQNKVDEILQQLGLNGETSEEAFPGTVAKTTEDLLLAFDLLSGKSPAGNGGDNVLFAAALGVGTNAVDESNVMSGDDVLSKLRHSGDKLGANNQLHLIALARVLEQGSKAGFSALLESANAKFSATDINGLSHLHEKLGTVPVLNLVVGVVTMSVMTREVVENLNHVVDNAAVGLSDNALAALQKAQNSLRDHLTSTDIIGAVGDLKHVPVDVGGNYYNFLPEVKEALNSLREARSRILSETMYLTSSIAGIESQQRFSREAEVLLGITQRFESFLNIG